MTQRARHPASAAPDRQRRVVQRNAELERQRRSLLELRDGLLTEEQGVTANITAVGAECDDLEAKLGAIRQRAAEIEDEIAASEQASATSMRELDALRRRVERQTEEVRNLEAEIEAHRSQIAAARVSFQSLKERVVRMDHMLRAGLLAARAVEARVEEPR